MTRPKMQGQCCGNCKWLEINPSNLTNHEPPRWRSKNGVGECAWPVPIGSLPLSITRSHGYITGLARTWMLATETGCPTWEAYEQEAEG